MIEGCSNERTQKVFIEFTPHCNFNCDFCAHHLVTRTKGVMELSKLEKLVAEIKRVIPDAEYIALSAMGEPLIYPHFMEACKIIKDAGFQLIVTTNGSLLTKEHHKAPVDRWYLSYRSTSDDAFAHRKAPLSYIDYTKRVVTWVRDSEHKNLVVYLQGNAEIEGYRQNADAEFANAINETDQEALISHTNYFGKLFCPTFKGVGSQKIMNEFIRLRTGLSIYTSYVFNWCNVILPKGYRVIETQGGRCPFYPSHTVFYWDGSVSTCCMDYDGYFVIGNVFDEPLDNILNRKLQPDEFFHNNRLCAKCRGRVVKYNDRT